MPSSLNGTGVTFNDGSTLQSGNIPAANMGSGTANSSTFLRGDRTWAAVPASAPTTAQVLTATAGASVGAVGTYALLAFASSGTLSQGSTVAGSNLTYTGYSSVDTIIDSSTDNPIYMSGAWPTTVSGTWRIMGRTRSFIVGSYQYGVSLFLRIS